MVEIDKKIEILLLRYVSCGLDAAGMSELRAWLQQDELNRLYMVKFLSLYKIGRQLDFLHGRSEEEAWQELSRKRRLNNRKLVLKKVLYVAASIVLIIGLGFGCWKMYVAGGEVEQSVIADGGRAILTLSNGERVVLDGSQRLVGTDGTALIRDSSGNLSYCGSPERSDLIYNQIDILRCGTYSLTLADGSRVWLNSDSRLRYPLSFTKTSREVELEGEAYFEVAKDETKPFIVNVAGNKIRVLGTQFNVSAYRDMNCIYTTLVEGSVNVESGCDERILTPDQQAVLVKESGNILVTPVESSFYISWLAGVVQFRDASLEDILKQLTRWYDVEVEFAREELKVKKFTGVIKKDKPLIYSLKAFEKISNIRFVQQMGKVIVCD